MTDATKILADIEARMAVLKAELHALRKERERARDRTPKRRAVKAKCMRAYLSRPEAKEKRREYLSRPEVMARDRARHRRKYAELHPGAMHPQARSQAGVDPEFDTG